jgi:hypothetical protein
MAELKIGRRTFNITDDDVVMHNGTCWQLMSQTYFDGWHRITPIMSKTMCEKFVKKNILVMYKKEREYVTTDGRQMGLYYYKFDMEKLNEFVGK